MAEEKPVTSGRATSEFSLTKWLIIIAGGLDVVSILFEVLHASNVLPEKPWVITALAATATVMAGLKALGYTRSRTLLKLAELAPRAASGVADISPFARATAQAVLELIQGREAQEEPKTPVDRPSTLPLQPK